MNRVSQDWETAARQSDDWRHRSRTFALATLAFILVFSGAAFASSLQEHASALTLFCATVGALGFLVCAVVAVSTMTVGWITDLRDEVRARRHKRKLEPAAGEGTDSNNLRP